MIQKVHLSKLLPPGTWRHGPMKGPAYLSLRFQFPEALGQRGLTMWQDGTSLQRDDPAIRQKSWSMDHLIRMRPREMDAALLKNKKW